MGQSTNAIIAFGFNLGDTLPEKLSEFMEDGEREMDECLAEDHGIVLPEYPCEGSYKEYSAAKRSGVAPAQD